MEVKILDTYPKELETIDVTEVYKLFPTPTLIHLKGEREAPLFLSALLHGNETSSLFVIQKLLKKYSSEKLPRDLIIFIGNAIAAKDKMRHLPEQPDYNRIWAEGEGAEFEMARSVIKYAQNHNIFASIDIHNNTGKNPYYGCVNSLDQKYIKLASHFGNHTVYFTEPHNVQSMAFSKFCPAVTIEAGLPGEPGGITAAFNYVDKVLNFDEVDQDANTDDLEVYHTIARIRLDKKIEIDFSDNKDHKNDISMVSNIDSRNFEVVPKGTRIGYAKNLDMVLVQNNNEEDITSDFFKIINNEIITNRTFIPSMFSKDLYVIKEDCLGYIMEQAINLN